MITTNLTNKDFTLIGSMEAELVKAFFATTYFGYSYIRLDGFCVKLAFAF